MDNFFRQQESTTQRPSGLLASQQIFNGLLHWLAGLVQLTEEEQKDAGVYLGDTYSRKYPFSTTIVKNSSHSDDKEKT